MQINSYRSLHTVIFTLGILLSLAIISAPGLAAACTDTDNGRNILINGVVTKSGITYTDFCSGDEYVYEYQCTAKGPVNGSRISCPSGMSCFEGACITPPANLVCIDSDNGKNPYVKGITYLQSFLSPSTDSCYDSKTLKEYYCSGTGRVEGVEVRCEKGKICKDGTCMEEFPPRLHHHARMAYAR